MKRTVRIMTGKLAGLGRRHGPVAAGLLRGSVALLIATGAGIAIADTPRPNFQPPVEAGITPASPARDLPLTVLTARDRGLYQQIFAYQADAKWGQADRLIKRLDDPLLVGHILRDRYLHPNAYRSSYTELADWLEAYYDLPDAYRIYRLAKKKQPKRAAPPKRPRAVSIRSRIPDADAPDTYRSNAIRNQQKATQVRTILNKIAALVDGGYVTRALDYLNEPDVNRYLDAVETDQQRAKIAAGYYHWGQIDQALDLAEQAAGRSGQQVPLAHWYAGLSWWQKGNIERAAYHFEQVAQSRAAGPWTRAAGAYWAARASLILLRSDNVVTMLNIASAYPRTMYGLLALRALGQDIVFRWDLPKLSDKSVSRLLSLPGVRRAIALTELGMDDRAEDEMAARRPVHRFQAPASRNFPRPCRCDIVGQANQVRQQARQGRHPMPSLYGPRPAPFHLRHGRPCPTLSGRWHAAHPDGPPVAPRRYHPVWATPRGTPSPGPGPAWTTTRAR